MAKKGVSVDLLCYFFDNKTSRKGCKGILVDVGAENGSRYNTRLRCRACSRVVNISKQELEQIIDEVRENSRQASTKD